MMIPTRLIADPVRIAPPSETFIHTGPGWRKIPTLATSLWRQIRHPRPARGDGIGMFPMDFRTRSPGTPPARLRIVGGTDYRDRSFTPTPPRQSGV